MSELQHATRFMAVGAHCDDVDLRCGGTFARLVREGRRGCYVVSVENAHVQPDFAVRDSHEALAVRRREAARAAEVLGAERIEWLELGSFYLSRPEPHSRIYPSFQNLKGLSKELRDAIEEKGPPAHIADRFPACCERLRSLVEQFAPEVVFTHYPDDRHPDHYAVARFVEGMVRSLREGGRPVDLYFWEPGSNGAMVSFDPDTFVEISEQDLTQKQRALAGYLTQNPDEMFERFASARAVACGEAAGVRYAEAFRRAPCLAAATWDSPSFVAPDPSPLSIYSL